MYYLNFDRYCQIAFIEVVPVCVSLLVLECWPPIPLVIEWVIKLFLNCQFNRYFFIIFSMDIRTVFVNFIYNICLYFFIYLVIFFVHYSVFYRNSVLRKLVVFDMCCRYFSVCHLAFDFVSGVFFQQKLKFFCSCNYQFFYGFYFLHKKKVLPCLTIISD